MTPMEPSPSWSDYEAADPFSEFSPLETTATPVVKSLQGMDRSVQSLALEGAENDFGELEEFQALKALFIERPSPGLLSILEKGNWPNLECLSLRFAEVTSLSFLAESGL